MKKFIIEVTTNWCGMDQKYAAIAENESELYELADVLAYDNFESFDCWTDIANELFPEKDVEDLTDEERDYVDEQESSYFSSSIEEVDEEDEDQLEDFNFLELVYDGSVHKNK